MLNPDNPAFGIDHPLIAVNDIDAVRQRLCAIGFNMTPVGKHPWGTSTSLAVFANCLLEIVGIHDERLLDEKPTADFRFGRHVHRHLQEREGVALTALHSLDMKADLERALRSGFEVAGQLEFGRDVSLPDGRAERTHTTLATLPDRTHPRLSFFLCRQHRRDLVEVPGWMEHANAVVGIAGITILAHASLHESLAQRLGALYGEQAVAAGGYDLLTANGKLSIRTREAVEEAYGPLPEAIDSDLSPAIVAMTFRSEDWLRTTAALAVSGLAVRDHDGLTSLVDARVCGNTFLSFESSSQSAGSRRMEKQRGIREDVGA